MSTAKEMIMPDNVVHEIYFLYLNKPLTHSVCFLWLSLPGDYRVTDEALLAETT